jgi:hypothetical protein
MPQRIRKKERHVVIEWGDVRDKVLSVVGDGKPWGPGPNAQHSHAREMAEAGKSLYGPPKCNKSGYGHKSQLYAYCRWEARQNQNKSWSGGTWADTMGWTRDGFRAPEFRHSAEYVPMAKRPRPQWNEEPDGDLDIGRLYGGYDNPYLVHSEAERKPGIRVMIEFAFAAGVSRTTIEKYGAWVAGLLGSMEASGYDLTVDLWIPLDTLFVDRKNPGMRDNVLMRVKRENEVADFTNWSVLFSPTGYRHVGFCAKLVAGDKLGLKASESLGWTLASEKGWHLDYDKENSILRIRVDQRGAERFGGDPFPREKLNKQAAEIGLIPLGGGQK